MRCLNCNSTNVRPHYWRGDIGTGEMEDQEFYKCSDCGATEDECRIEDDGPLVECAA